MPFHAQAWTVDGYFTSGGVGQIKCANFQNAVAEARTAGMASQRAITITNPFIQYAFGFYTQYNASAPGVFDVLDGFRGDQMHVSVLTILDNYCEANPANDFNDALMDSIRVMLPSAKMGPTQ